MLFDLESMFSDAQAITATAVSTNTLDFGAVDTPKHAAGPITRDVGRGRPIPVVVQVVQTFNTLTSLRIDLEVSDAADFGSGVVVVSSITVPLARLTAGERVAPFYLPEGMNKRYARLNYVVSGTNPTQGRVTAGLVFGVGGWSA